MSKIRIFLALILGIACFSGCRSRQEDSANLAADDDTKSRMQELLVQAQEHIGVPVELHRGFKIKDDSVAMATLERITKIDNKKLKPSVIGKLVLNRVYESPMDLAKQVLITPSTTDQKIIELLNSRPQDQASWETNLTKLKQRRQLLSQMGRNGGSANFLVTTDESATFEQEMKFFDLLDTLFNEGYRFDQHIEGIWPFNPGMSMYQTVNDRDNAYFIKANVTRTELIKYLKKVR